MPDPIRQLTLTPALTTLVKDVFGPSAKLVGTELRSFLKEKIDDARERRRSENLSRHIFVVRAALPKPSPEQVSYERLDMFSEWVDGAQDVSDSNPELAEMWREVLRRIVEGESVSKSLIAIMKQVDAPMAQLLLRFRRKKGPLDEVIVPVVRIFKLFGFGGPRRFADEDLFNARRLAAIGLLDRDYSFNILGFVLTGIVIVAGYFFGMEYIFGSKSFSILRSDAGITLVVKLEVLAVALILLWVAVRRIIARQDFRLTWTARRLLTYATKYEERDKRVA